MKRSTPGFNNISRGALSIIFLTLVNGCGYLSSNRNNLTPTPDVNAHVASSTASPVAAPTPPSPTNPVASPTPPPTKSATAPSIYQDGCLQPSSRDYIYGNYSVGWLLHGDYYKSILLMKGSSGKMLTEYFNPAIKGTDAVLQTMTLQVCSFGLVIVGSNPLNPKTLKPHLNYAADGLVLRRQPNGKVFIFACDTAKNCSPAEVKRITS